jgi:glutaminase
MNALTPIEAGVPAEAVPALVKAGTSGLLRKQKRFMTAALVEELIKSGDDEEGFLIQITKKLLGLAASGEMAAIKEVFDRVEGKPVQAVELTGANQGPLMIINASMTPADAAREYARTLESEGVDVE